MDIGREEGVFEIPGRTYAIRIEAAKLAANDLHLERHHWQSNGDIVSRLAELAFGPLTPEECDEAVRAYDDFLGIFEETR